MLDSERVDLGRLSAASLDGLTNEQLQSALGQALGIFNTDRQQNQLVYYEPNQPAARSLHASRARVRAAFAGNGAGKTDTCLAEIVALATGIFPTSIKEELLPKFRGPIATRVVIESLTTTLTPIILPKLQYWKWNGIDRPGGDRGHWGWIPKESLLDGDWSKSWSEKLRYLRLVCRDPEDPESILGESTLQLMSIDQDASDFASGDFHIVLHDEPPSHAIWRENQARTMRVDGVMMLSMTWPDDPSIPVDWIYDEIYDKARDGANRDDDVEMYELSTLKNPNLDQVSVAAQARKWSQETRLTRIEGQPIRFSNRVHPLFTDAEQEWCFNCGKPVISVAGRCTDCEGDAVAPFCHVREFETARNWPTIWLLDPHPRKPHMFMWAQVDPSDDIWIVADGSLEGDPGDVKRYCDRIETELGLDVKVRIMDPNMGASPSGAKRGVTWQREFAEGGLNCDLADDGDVGRSRVNEYLKPDQHRWQPRIHFHPRCREAIFQMKRFTWSDFKKKEEKDQKQVVRKKFDDYAALLRYLMNYNPQFRWLHEGAPVIGRGRRKGAYR